MNPNPPFFGTQVSQQGINVTQATPNQLLYQLDLNSGTQTFFGTNGDVNFGLFTSVVTGTQTMGMQIIDSAGNVVFEMDGQTWYWFDPLTNINVMQIGLLPDGTYGFAVAAPGQNVIDGYVS
jgi:hypothetical protein